MSLSVSSHLWKSFSLIHYLSLVPWCAALAFLLCSYSLWWLNANTASMGTGWSCVIKYEKNIYIVSMFVFVIKSTGYTTTVFNCQGTLLHQWFFFSSFFLSGKYIQKWDSFKIWGGISFTLDKARTSSCVLQWACYFKEVLHHGLFVALLLLSYHIPTVYSVSSKVCLAC